MKEKMPPKQDRSQLKISPKAGESADSAIARTLLRPEIQAAGLLQHLSGDLLEINTLAAQLLGQSSKANGGSLARAEAMIVSQMHTLDALYNQLAKMGASVLKGNLDQGERLFRLALRAQGQCRATVEALAEMKNPRSVAFVRQANIAGGHQQVNNGIASRAGENQIPPNELGALNHGERLDSGTAGATGGADSAMATVGTVNRPANKRGKGPRISKRK